MVDQRLRRWADVVQMLYKLFCACWDVHGSIGPMLIRMRPWSNLEAATCQAVEGTRTCRTHIIIHFASMRGRTTNNVTN